ncbi:MAG: hypothetical protein Fur009_4270 [Candidatus Microgenomates bacterium]
MKDFAELTIALQISGGILAIVILLLFIYLKLNENQKSQKNLKKIKS